MQAKGGLGGGQQRVAPVLGLAAGVGGHAAELHVEFGGGHKVVSTADDGTCRHAGPDMDRREIIHVINHAGGHHRAGAAGTLFSRLENQFNDAIELGGIPFEHMRQPQPDGGMAVMAAGVHHAGVAGGEMIAMGAVAIVMLFVEIEGIHIDAKGRGWPGRPVSSVATTPAKPPSNAGSQRSGAPCSRARSKAGRGLLVRQPHPAVGIDDVAA